MFTHKDIEFRAIFVINCFEGRTLKVSNGELLLQENESGNKTLTKFPFQKILALFIIGHISITTPLIEKCKQNGVALVVMKQNLRPVFYWADTAEANFLLRKKQYEYSPNDITVAKALVSNKIQNQIALLNKIRGKTPEIKCAIHNCQELSDTISICNDYNSLMGIEGRAAKSFFSAYFKDMEWKGRRPRVKSDPVNATLDFGYTILFNFIECYVRLFGFDIYVGVYHRLWFKRKSLICDLMEPFRCIIENTTRTAINKKRISSKDFNNNKGEYRLKLDKIGDYCKVYMDALIPYKTEIFKYIQNYYRAFMKGKASEQYPNFVY